MIEVLPAIIPLSLEQLEEEMKKVSFAPKVQVDISDGIFTPTKTWPYNGQKIGQPDWRGMEIELHLMVENPENVLNDWIEAGVSGIVAHIEATKNFQKIIDVCCAHSVSVGIAMKPSTDTTLIEPFAEKVDFIQVMGSDHIGMHGVKLEEKALEKIKLLREKYPRSIIAIDIGVTTETAEMLVNAGANKLISGSAILHSENPKKVYNYLKNEPHR